MEIQDELLKCEKKEKDKRRDYLGENELREEEDRSRKKRKMEDQMQNHAVTKRQNPVMDGGARIQKLKRDSDVMCSLMYEMFCLLHERDSQLFREADDMLENALTRMNRLRRNKGAEYVGRWRLKMDSFTEEEANKRGEAYIEILHNLEGTFMYGDSEGKLQGELGDDHTLQFSWQGFGEERPFRGVGHLRFSDFHAFEDRIEGAFDLEEGDVPQELAYCTFKAHRILDTIIEEFLSQ